MSWATNYTNHLKIKVKMIFWAGRKIQKPPPFTFFPTGSANPDVLLSFAQLGEGARALARFNVASHAVCKTPSTLVFSTLKRRERRAPLRFAGV
jgi:hypothetical protein